MTERGAQLAFNGFHLDRGNRLLTRDGQSIALTPKAFDTLVALIERQGRVVGKEELLETVWPGAFITEATLSQNIYTLRKTLESHGASGLIQTVPRRGYRFAGEAVEVRRETASDAPAEELPESIRSVAVLPLVSLGGDEEIDFLGLGLADAVIASLSRVRRLTVRSTSAILRYVEEGDRDPVRIGRDLAVDGVLEGTVQRLGARLRVTVQLVSVARSAACWAESFQGVYDDLFEAQDAIAHAVVAGLRLTLTRQEEAGLRHQPTRSTDACRAYVRGRYFWNKRSAADLKRAIESFEHATALDPGYAQAHAGLADAWILMPFFGAGQPAASFRKARDAARRAGDLDGSLAEAHTSLAYTDFVYSRRWRTAEERFRRALSCNPHYATAHHWYAFLLTALGRHDEALQRATRALELEPLSAVIHTDLAMAHYFARRYDDAAAVLDTVVENDPSFGYARFARSLTASARQQQKTAIDEARAAVEHLPGSTAAESVLGYALAVAGRIDEARDVLAELGSDNDEGAQAAHRALVWVGLDDRERAFAELEEACDERSNFAALLGVWPVFDRIRPDPRFAALLRRIRLAPG